MNFRWRRCGTVDWCDRSGYEGSGVHVRDPVSCGCVRRDTGVQSWQPYRLRLWQIQDRLASVQQRRRRSAACRRTSEGPWRSGQ